MTWRDAYIWTFNAAAYPNLKGFVLEVLVPKCGCVLPHSNWMYLLKSHGNLIYPNVMAFSDLTSDVPCPNGCSAC